jgi:hypothetical protein
MPPKPANRAQSLTENWRGSRSLHGHSNPESVEPSQAVSDDLFSISDYKVVLDVCEQRLASDVLFRAHGSTAVVAQASIVNTHIRSNALISIAAYATFAFLIAVAGCLVAFAPTGGETAATVAAAALFAVAVVIGDIKAFRISLPGMDFLAGQTGSTLPANNKKRARKKAAPDLASRT